MGGSVGGGRSSVSEEVMSFVSLLLSPHSPPDLAYRQEPEGPDSGGPWSPVPSVHAPGRPPRLSEDDGHGERRGMADIFSWLRADPTGPDPIREPRSSERQAGRSADQPSNTLRLSLRRGAAVSQTGWPSRSSAGRALARARGSVEPYGHPHRGVLAPPDRSNLNRPGFRLCWRIQVA